MAECSGGDDEAARDDGRSPSGRLLAPLSYGVMVTCELCSPPPPPPLCGDCCGSLYSPYAAFISRCVWSASEDDSAETGAGVDGDGDMYEPTGEPNLALAMRLATAFDVSDGGSDSSDDSSSSDVAPCGDVSVEECCAAVVGEARDEVGEAAAARLATARGEEMRAASMDGPRPCRRGCMATGAEEGGDEENTGSTASLCMAAADV